MTPLQYVNKDLHTPQGRRKLHEAAKKPDLQRIKREARIQEHKRRNRYAPFSTPESAGVLEKSVRSAFERARFYAQQTTEFVRQHPLPTAVGVIFGGALVGLLMRRNRH